MKKPIPEIMIRQILAVLMLCLVTACSGEAPKAGEKKPKIPVKKMDVMPVLEQNAAIQKVQQNVRHDYSFRGSGSEPEVKTDESDPPQEVDPATLID